MVDTDRRLLAGRPPRAVFLPTAAAEEGADTVAYWLDLGQRHFELLAVEPVPLRVLTRQDADDPALAAVVAGAGLVYLSGGNPGYLASTLRQTLVWEAIVAAWRTGAAVVGCSAGAAALSWVASDVRAERARRAVAVAGTTAEPIATDESGEGAGDRPTGLALVDSLAVIPHFDRIVSWVPGITQRYIVGVPSQVAIIGVDEDTAIVSSPGGRAPFQVTGRQAAWVINRDGSKARYGAGDTIEAGDLLP
jgi:cyanophycinase